MSFLLVSELKSVVPITLVDKITGNDNTIPETVIIETVATIRGKLSKYYDTDAIFAATGDLRHPTIMKFVKDIVRFELYDRGGMIGDASRFKMKRDEALAELEKLNTGENFDRTLPPRPPDTAADTSTSSEDIRFGGSLRYNSSY